MLLRGRCFVAVVILLGAAAGPAGAATLTVNTTADNTTFGDNGMCTLRTAIAAVNSPGTATDCGKADASGNTIVLGARTYQVNFSHVLFIGPPPSGCVSASVQQPDDNSSGELSVAGSVHALTIVGAGADKTVLDACKLADRALEVKAGATVTLRGVTITNGHAQEGKGGSSPQTEGSTGGAGDPGAAGGGILNGGTLTLIDSAVTHSDAGDGGDGGTGGTLGGSGGPAGAGGAGGGIFNAAGASLTLTDSTISGNAAGAGGRGGAGTQGSTANGQSGNGGAGGDGNQGGAGGGVANSGGTLRATGTTIDHNTSGSGGAGAAGQNADSLNGGAGGNGGFGGNGGPGAGIDSAGGSLQAINDTIYANTAGKGGDAGSGGAESQGLEPNGTGGNGGSGGGGGGLFAVSSTASLLNVTMAGNASGNHGSAGTALDQPGKPGSDGLGGGIYSLFATMTLRSTLLADNQPGGDCRGTIDDGGHNLVFSPPSVGPLQTDLCDVTNFVKADPKLGPLQNNLGPTLTMALGAGSAAKDQIPAGSGCPATDQRGFKRPRGPACDIGAYEVTPPAVTTAPATARTTTAATIRGSVTPFSTHATVRFQFGKTTTYGSATATQTVSGRQAIAIAAHLTGLTPNTTYHFRVTATSTDGTSNSSDATFRTAALPPAVTKLKLKRSGGHATLTYRDSESAKTTFIVRRCTKRAAHTGKCLRWVRVLSFIHHDTAGSDVAHFTPPHKAGHYQVIATPKANGLTGHSVRLAFRVT